MKTWKLSKLAGALSLLVTVVVAGCDAEGPPMPDETAAMVDDESSDAQDDDDDNGDDGGDEGHVVVALAAPTQPQSGLHPCGNAVIDPGEECDDGLANGNNRECTYACTLNDCDLDEHGYCEHHGPAADVDLYPCANTGDPRGCNLGLAGN